jgi:hypothetical protein
MQAAIGSRGCKSFQLERKGLSLRLQLTGSHFFSGPKLREPATERCNKPRIHPRVIHLQRSLPKSPRPFHGERARWVRPGVNFQPKRADVKCHSCQQPPGAGRLATHLSWGHDSGRDLWECFAGQPRGRTTGKAERLNAIGPGECRGRDPGMGIAAKLKVRFRIQPPS